MAVFRPGDVVRIHGLQNQTDVNGLWGTIIDFIEGSGRWKVVLANREIKAIRRENLALQLDSGPETNICSSRPLLQMPRFDHPWQVEPVPEQRQRKREEMTEEFVDEMGEPLSSQAQERLLARWQPGQSRRYRDAYEAWLKSGEYDAEYRRDGLVFYHPELVIGQGAHAKVFLGIVPSDGREVAVKVYSQSQGGEHFAKEVQAMKQNAAVHGVIQYITSFEKDRLWVEEKGKRKRSRHEQVQVVILELMEGTLQQAISNWGSPDADDHIDTICHVSHNLLDILKHLNPNMIHRDIKPDNIMVDCRGNIKLPDFGISRMMTGGQSELYTETAGSSLPYTPPEALRSKLHKTSDLYSVGRVMLAMMLSDATMRRMGDSAVDDLVPTNWPKYRRFAFVQLVRALIRMKSAGHT